MIAECRAPYRVRMTGTSYRDRLPRTRIPTNMEQSLSYRLGLAVLRGYQPGWLPHDLAAGLVLTTMLVPVGIAYAVASGVPGIYGLYATIVPLLAYALFGPSRILVLGPDSSLAALIFSVVVPLSALVTFPPGTQLGVFVVEGDKAVKRLVKTGDILNSSILITEGLRQGEQVITSGAAFLHDAAPIVIAGN